ncbi:MAG: TadG family pilus assembly protein [Xylophilus ampelinus]
MAGGGRRAMAGRRRRDPGAARRHGGAAAILAAFWMLVGVACLMSIDIGSVFWQRRELQRVADLAALAGAEDTADGCAAAVASAVGNARSNGYEAPLPVDAACGTWDLRRPVAGTDPVRHFHAGDERLRNAVRVRLARTVPYFFAIQWGTAGRAIGAEATAARQPARAALAIRTATARVDSAQAAWLDPLVGGLLGGQVALGVAGWQGLADASLGLLAYLDQLAVDLGVAAGAYEQVLQAQASAGALLGAAATVLERDGAAASAAVRRLQVAAAPGPALRLGDLVRMQAGAPASALDTRLQLASVVQAVAQLAGSRSGAAVEVPLASVPGIGSVAARVRVVEPPQISAVGNPMAARAEAPGFAGPGAIRVRTAQVRILVAANLPGLSGIAGLANAVLGLLAPVTGLLNGALNLRLSEVVCLGCTQSRVVLALDSPLRLHLQIDTGSAEAWVTDFECGEPGARTLSVGARTAAAQLRVGQMSAADEAASMSSAAAPAIAPMPLLDVETSTCTLVVCGPWSKHSRTGLKADLAVGANTASYVFDRPAGVHVAFAVDDAEPFRFAGRNVVASLTDGLEGLQLQTYTYDAARPNRFGSLVGGATQLVSSAAGAVKGVVDKLLAPLLAGPAGLEGLLLRGLGIELAATRVNARLSCSRDVDLVW